MVNRATAVVLMSVLSLAAACSPAAATPTPVPQPTSTPVEVRATKIEHLVGIWFDGDSYGRHEADGTITWAESLENLDIPHLRAGGRFWYEDGVHYEETFYCEGVFACEAYLRIEDGRAVRLRLHTVEVLGEPCDAYSANKDRILTRVD